MVVFFYSVNSSLYTLKNMKCHYEVLDITSDANSADIKSAYRKLALKWHPDKNLDNPEYAKEQFQIVQQAYEVLSDKQERAWYDAHKDQILRGANSEFQDKSLDVFQYFTTSCFKGYEDDENGFYTVYRKIFEQIAKEDIEFMDEKEDFCEIPGFGKSDTDYENVKAFYDYWLSYSTKKSYSWLDPYDIREGKGDRRILKLIEKENKKVRLKAKKERSEEVRNLVAFVRKRDKRVQAYKRELDAKTLENRKKQEMLSKQKRLERQKLRDTEKQADWLKFDNVQSELEEVEKHLAQEFGDKLSNSEEEDFNNLYCVACNKMFKTPKAFENHELSKKHKENIDILRQTMLEEELQSNLSDELEEYDELDNHEILEEAFEQADDLSAEDSITDEENSSEITFNTKKMKKEGKKQTDNYENSEETEDFNNEAGQVGGSDQELGNAGSRKSKKKKRRTKNNIISNELCDVTKEEDLTIGQLSDDDFDFGISKSQKKKNKKSILNKSKQNVTVDGVSQLGTNSNVDIDNNDQLSTEGCTKTKKNTKKEKKSNKRDSQAVDLCDIDTNHCCVACKGTFPSKNKLFDHLKKTGHGTYIPPKIKQQINKKML